MKRAIALVVCAGCYGHVGARVARIERAVVPGLFRCDGRVTHYEDDGADRTAVFHYDDDGRLVSYVETFRDGTVTNRYRYEYDAAGHVVWQTEDSSSGVKHVERTMRYDARGRLRWSRNVLDDEVYEYEQWYRPGKEWMRDVSGDGRVEVSEMRVASRDPLVIEDVHDTWTWRYTFEGRRIAHEESVDADGKVTPLEDFTYDGDGHLVRLDGHPSISRYTWADGHVVAVAYDEQGDGVVDQHEEYTYEMGRLVKKRWTTEEGTVLVTLFEPDRVERRTEDPDELIEGWTIQRGCGGQITIPLAPVSSWEDESDPIGHDTELGDFAVFQPLLQ